MEKTLDEAIGIAKKFLLGASVLYIKEYIYMINSRIILQMNEVEFPVC